MIYKRFSQLENIELVDYISTHFFKYGKDYLIVDGNNLLELSNIDNAIDIALISLKRQDFYFPPKQVIKELKLCFDMNRLKDIEYKKAPLIKKDRYKLEGEILTVYKPFLKDFVREVYNKEDKSILKGALKHFNFLPDFIRIVTFGRITTLKNSFVHLLIESNYGKSMLMSAFESLDLTYEIDNIGEIRRDNSISADKVANSLFIFEDESKGLTDEHKKNTFKVAIAEKFKMRKSIDVGVKVLMSANNPYSSAKDEQLYNRLELFDLRGKGKIDDKEFYKKYGYHRVIDALKKYIKNTILDILEELKEQEDINIYSRDKYLKAIENIRGGARNKDETKKPLRDEIYDTLLENISSLLDNKENIEKVGLLQDSIIDVGDIVFLKRPKKTIARLLMMSFSSDEVKHMMSYYNEFIESGYCIDYRNKAIRVGNMKTKSKGVALAVKSFDF
jgi:hypothetical protein